MQAKDTELRTDIWQELEGQNAPKPSSKYLEDRICKIK